MFLPKFLSFEFAVFTWFHSTFFLLEILTEGIVEEYLAFIR